MGSISETPLPYWQVNVPRDRRTDECPEGLRNLSAKDIGILSTPDERYRPQTWAEVKLLVETNRLDLFQRVPSELRRYRLFIHDLIKDYGSVMEFVQRHRLGWTADDDGVLRAKGRPFEFPDDWRVLCNDWPYGIDGRIVHLVVWTKFELEEDVATGDLTEGARRDVEEFVTKTFRSRVRPDSVIWFKNWRSLKSVHAVEHFHIMLFDPDPDFVRDITGGDVPQCDKFEL
ncbi:N-acetylglucosamine-induced protein 1-like protein 1 [Colletotrichum chlorophyti]|uniref:N-acetylglucosamine-induced protein 1-like protein 1 n=1 Tax=Colletotrichum chlorophyti TaxID=708187 RepID=A0A1Q8S0W4_9PEZI|nr:N-acetylglucosamine-induced protein 1-like protein 1 [Colletotrichum chlorophyti]